jgi:predicted metalloprotease with PDZ domain
MKRTIHSTWVVVWFSVAWALSAAAPACAQTSVHSRGAAPIQYRFTFAEPEHHWMQVEVVFSDLPRTPLELRMSRSSPGRYAVHDFAKNVYDVHATTRNGAELPITRPDADGWNVTGHDGSVTVKYKIYGDRVDGTYLAIDATHAHINMPAAVMWAHGLDDRRIVLDFEPPKKISGAPWSVATQLHPAAAPYEFTAANLQYLMDSPAEFGPVVVREFTSGPRKLRFAIHHTGTDAEVDAYAKDVEKIVAQEGAIYGEFPEFEPGNYTFLADYLPWANGDGMEHRNSTVMTSAGSIRDRRLGLLETVAHEFFHCWNIERIRPKSLEPFDFDRANISGELWLGEGFTSYYGGLVMQRAGLVELAATARTLTGFIESVTQSPGSLVRSAEEMSRMAPFIDGGRPIDRTNWSNTVISYYPFGGAIALALDLTLRERSEGKITLDDYMRAMWRVHGKPGGSREGYVDHPYTMADAEGRLGEIVNDAAFARQFFARYVQGHDAADYGRLLARAGFELRKRNPGRAWWGDLRLDFRNGSTFVSNLTSPASPAYAAGIDQDDEIRSVDGQSLATAEALNGLLLRHKPGDHIEVIFVDRTGAPKTAAVTLVEDPHVEVVPLENGGGTLTPAQKSFRDAWLGPRATLQ